MNKALSRWLFIVALLVVAGGAAAWLLRGSAEPPVAYETVAIARGDLASHATASGTVSALVTVQVGSQVSGRIESLFADFNAQVKKGDVVAKIDPRLFEADVRKARANVTAAAGNLARTKAEVDLAERELARAKELRAAGLASQSELDTAESRAAAAKAQVSASRGAVEQAQAAAYQAETYLAYTTIKSPIDGVVISRSVDVGQTVAASLSAPTLFTIAEDLRKMQVDTFVAEADVGKLSPGMAATFTVDAFPGRRFRGVVREIRNAPQTVQNVVTYDAVIDVDNAQLDLKPGMTANVSLVVAERKDALTVPNAALRFRPGPELAGAASASASASPDASAAPAASSGARRRGGRGGGTGEGRAAWKTLWVMRDGAPTAVPVRTGITDGTSTEIVEGPVAEGDAVVVVSTGGAAAAPRPTSTSMPRVF